MPLNESWIPAFAGMTALQIQLFLYLLRRVTGPECREKEVMLIGRKDLICVHLLPN
jgi:hypothetical protein